MRPHYLVGWTVFGTISRLLWGMRATGGQAVPERGAVVIACNHISNWDPVLVGLACRRELHFMAKEELFRIRPFGAFIRAYNALPVRRGALDRRALAAALSVLRKGGALLVFPEGTRSRTGDLGDARPGVAYLASAGGAVLVPAAIAGSHELSKALLRRRRVRVAFGEPLEAGSAQTREEYVALTDRVMESIAKLRAALEAA